MNMLYIHHPMMPVFYLKQLFPKNQKENETEQKQKKASAAASPLFLSLFFSSTCAETGSTHKFTIINTRRLVYT
ncbi:hypothetical protein TRIATDRAFT_296996 [Trichoderma atroviride IMI 206040]|uniref:Uncharacterized protein n=1 Tax=Hypocrea atroviridis (strain ATCC 20476 / IMI 206040) TaxID=452589 RepID=G9NF90_HYPAI|nr:uncharacterized protein TRIATDRAFT_296996 [Trichoderma atroviride IMI 206040]EHK50606.1 hypothetical protein TRIATDRAFT_296996 [Trichoderma atroviride IMI 206040]